MKIIEFFGLPGSGKTFFKKKLIKNFLSNYKIYDYRSFNLIFYNKNILTQSYFRLIKNDNLKKVKNFFYKNKINISILNIFYKNYKSKINKSKIIKNSENLNFIKLLIKNSNFPNNKKKDFLNWAREELIANQLAKKIKSSKEILIDSEGLIQRLLIYCYNKKNKREIIKKYLSKITLPNIIIYFEKIYSKKIFSKFETEELQLIFNLVLKILKQKNVLLINSDLGLLKIKKIIISKNK